MKTFRVGRIVPVVALSAMALALALIAQVAQNPVPLKNWSSPQYWQPAQADKEEAAAGPLVASPPGALVFVAMPICRVVDTRASQTFASPFGAPGLMPGPARTFPLQSSGACSIPSNAQAYSLNVTVVPGRGLLDI